MKKEKKCQICGKNVLVDDYGNGFCKICKWHQSNDAYIYPNAINPPNFLSYNEAREYYMQNKKYTPNFDRILELIGRGLDIFFKYKNKKYQLSKHNDYTLWEVNTNKFEAFGDLNKLKENAKIDDILLKDLWKKIKYIRYDC